MQLPLPKTLQRSSLIFDENPLNFGTLVLPGILLDACSFEVRLQVKASLGYVVNSLSQPELNNQILSQTKVPGQQIN